MKAKHTPLRISKPAGWIACFVLLLSAFFVFADRYGDLELFARILNLVEKNHFKPLSSKTLIHGAVRGLLREIDPYSYFFTPEDLAEFTGKTEGRDYGIGVELGKNEKGLIILSVVSKSPAEKAGLKRGDRLVEVDGKSIKGITVEEFYRKFKKGKTRTLSVFRANESRRRTVRLQSAPLRIKSVQFRVLKNGELYVRIFQFTKTTLLELNAVLKKRSPARGVLLDLRGNPGGVFDQAVKVADRFISRGKIVSFKMRQQKQNQSFSANMSGTLPDFPLVVLMDEYSASAGEVLIGALRDHNRALLVGRRSFGKGSIQKVFHLKTDYGVKLTVGEYQTPSGALIRGRGIEPHIQIERSPETDSSVAVNKKNLQDDPEIAKALEYLKNFREISKKFLGS